MTAIWPKLRKPSRRGMVAVFVALSLTIMVAAAALTLDGGLIISERRRAQTVADGAALAGSYSLYRSAKAQLSTTSANSAAVAVAISSAASNGYTNYAMNDGPPPQPSRWSQLASLPIAGLPLGPFPILANQGTGGGPAPALVVAYAPPISGSFKGQQGYVQVNVTRYIPRYFSALWESGTMAVSAQSVARGILQPSAAPNAAATNQPFVLGIQLLNLSMSGAMTSNVTLLNIPAGAVIVDSLNGTAATSSATAVVSANSISVSGNYSGNYLSNTGSVNTGVLPTADPFSYLPEPSSSSLTSRAFTAGSTLQPGVYSGGIKATSGSVTLSPGIYYLNGGGLSITGTASLSGSNVLIYNAPTGTTDGVTINTTGTVSLSPMTAGTYEGFTIFQNRTSIAPINMTGNNNLTNNGAVYAAAAALNLTGNGLTDVFASRMVADHATLSGLGTINVGTGSAVGVRDTRIVQ